MKYISILFIWLFFMPLLSSCGADQEREVVTQVDFKQVLWFAERAHAAYKTEADIRKLLPKTVRVIPDVADTEVSYFLEQDDTTKQQLIAVRGTANLENAREDAEYVPSKNKHLGIYVHQGFDSDAVKIYNDVLPYLKKDYQTAVTGHSLGGAVAALLMMYLHEDGFPLVRSINFGQPKVTNSTGVKEYAFLPLTRVVDENDVVPQLPPVTLLDSLHGIYEHLGDEVVLLKDEFYAYLARHQAQEKSVASFWKNLGQEDIPDHFMASYLKNIQNKISHAVQVPYSERGKYLR
ncbi:MAG: lipase family protein [Candidatus Electrothrix sp. YB6]